MSYMILNMRTGLFMVSHVVGLGPCCYSITIAHRAWVRWPGVQRIGQGLVFGSIFKSSSARCERNECDEMRGGTVNPAIRVCTVITSKTNSQLASREYSSNHVLRSPMFQ